MINKTFLYKVTRGAVLFVALVAAYLLLGLLAWCVPDAPVHRHVEQTINSCDLQDDYTKAIVRDKCFELDPYTMDNFTDALIINQVVNLRSEGLKGILLLPRHDEGVVQCHNLRQLMAGSEQGVTTHYARYWHGTTFVARLLLALTSYSNIRFFLYFLSSSLLLWCLLRLWKRVGKVAAVVLAFSLLSVNLFVMQFSLQFVPVLIITLGGILWLTYHPSSDGELLFLVLGSLTVFFDLITVPTVALGLPLVIWVAMHPDHRPWCGLCTLLKLGLWWVAGYLLTWMAKWGITTLFTGENVFADAYGQSRWWTDGGSSYIMQALSSNLALLHYKYVVLALFALLAMAVISPRGRGWKQAVQYLPLALIPFVYYVVMAHPAFNHAWFNYRALLTAVAALLMAAAAMVDWPNLLSKSQELRNKKH
ncbi:MAG: hypothetical protein IJK84_00730 [Bacteroidales bacterium]|nr:hypothetical protein [Bacteroidales bacterium]